MTRTIAINYEELQMTELSEAEQKLVQKAYAATANSYANYSHFHVGAAIRLSDGSIVIGANQENAAFTVGLCAERTAIYAAQAQHPELAITAIAITARNADGYLDEPVAPCGSCRQVMLEMEDRYHTDMEILLCGTSKIYRLHSVKDLVPFAFVDKNMR